MAQDHPTPFNVKSSIMAAIEGTEDKAMRTILLLMLGVLEESAKVAASIDTKLDELLADERALKDKVLNGHSDKHDSHHDWIQARIDKAEELDSLCAWVRQEKKAKELEAEEAEKNAKANKRVAIETAIRQLVIIGISLAFGGMTVATLLK